MAPADNWDHVQQIFLAVADRSPAERASLLQEMCGGDAVLRAEVESLLRSDSATVTGLGTVFDRAIQTEAVSLFDESAAAGSRLGAYRLIREIGRGGMGSVFLASRADEQYESEVAIKLVRPGFDTDFILRRFRRERQILARLHHPNIARLFDGGTTENQVPYLVMEYVQGSRITRYAEEKRLSVSDRLRLFLPVCSAVEHAHRAFIVHRDLKPANILVDRTGTPKLLDFGISKLLHSEPREWGDSADLAMATPDYASPEQIVGDPVTAASDVYSLGAVLYELLTGLRPHRIPNASPQALERAICLEPITPPSAALRGNTPLARRLAGDLDAIVLCAMQKAPERRYASAEHLADDLRRHLEHRPVAARPDSAAYRAGKFLRRNRIPASLAGTATSAMAVLAGFAIYETRAGQEKMRKMTAAGRALQRELACVYGLLGDLQAHAPEGVRAYTARRAITKALWEADPTDARSQSDYAVAQVGLGLAIPAERASEKRAVLEQARDWLKATVRQSPANPALREQLNQAHAALAALAQGRTQR
jgi:serine/threonine protein kinase